MIHTIPLKDNKLAIRFNDETKGITVLLNGKFLKDRTGDVVFTQLVEVHLKGLKQ